MRVTPWGSLPRRVAANLSAEVRWGLHGGLSGAGRKHKVFFYHQPKTGGTSLWQALRSLAGTRRVFQVSSRARSAEFSQLSWRRREWFNVVGGHFELSYYRQLLDLERYYCLTVFRDPLRRLQSHYYYSASNPNDSDHPTVSRMTLREFAEWKCNPISHLLCGAGDAQAAFDVVTTTFDQWVFLDELDQLVADLQARAGRRVRPAPRVNVGPRRDGWPPLDAGTIAAIERHHAADIELDRLLRQAQRAPAGQDRGRPLGRV